MTLYDLNQDAVAPESGPDYVRIRETCVGKGVYAVRRYPACAVIGEIKGELIVDPKHGTAYSFEALAGCQLEPEPPFRFVNHSCEPNCEFEWIEDPTADDSAGNASPTSTGLYLSAIRNIEANEQFTIDYNWPASYAIPCQCNQPLCRGWIVAAEELEAARILNQAYRLIQI